MVDANLKEGNYKLAAFIKGFDYDDVPAQVKEHAKICLLDLIGAMLGGSVTRTAKLAVAFANRMYQGSDATIVAGKAKSNVIGATFANAFTANALDIDDGFRLVKGHPGALIIPAALSVAEWKNKTGRDLMESIILGYEVGTRAGIIWHNFYPVYHSSGSWGSIATAVTTAKLLGLDIEQLYNTLGLAEWQAPMNPMMRCIDYPSMVKDGIGWGSPAGVTSALMAADGFTGSPSLFGYKQYDHYIESLGQDYNLLKLYFKPYACCRWAQPGIAGALKITLDNHVRFEDIEKINVYTFKESAALLTACPVNSEEAEYNIAYPIATALRDGEVGPKQVLDDRLFDPTVLGLMNKIEIIPDPRFDLNFPQCCESEVEIILKSGASHRSGAMRARGDFDNPLSKDELRDKFIWLAGHVKEKSEIEEIINIVENIDSAHELKGLTRLLID